MGKQPFISHVVNGYSRYDVPESKAFTCTPGILYPVRIDFINARDRVSIEQGIDVRSNPLAVPTFNPYTVRLHRFWVPLQLYHPEMRTNSSKFDMNGLSLNWISSCQPSAGSLNPDFFGAAYTNSLMSWLRVANKYTTGVSNPPTSVALPSDASMDRWSNADTYLAYWDIVRNYYGFSQWGLFSFAWPMANKLIYASDAYSLATASGDSRFFTQCYGNLEFLDAYFESQFYPSAVTSANNTFNRSNLFNKISSQFAVMEAGTADFSLMDLELFHPDGQLVERKTHPYLNNFPDQKELIRLHLMYHLTGTDTMMFRRDYLLKTGGFGSVDIGDEFYLMMKAIEKGGRFVYLPQSLVHACVHYDGSGLSGGPLKRQGEEMLFQFKRTYFPNLSPSDIRFIRMRHHAVLAFAYLKQGDLLHFLCEAMQSFFLSPVGCIRMLSQRKNQK